jgi:chemotaxis protein histidine kinase CheA
MSDVGNFELKSIRRELREDLRRYRREINEALDQVAEDHEFEKHFEDVNRCAHAVRGVSSLVGAWAMVFWCEDVEKLARFAMEKHARDPERSHMITAFLRQNHDAFEKIGNRVLNNDLDGALDIYSEIRSTMPLELREVTTERDQRSMEYASGKRTARVQHQARQQSSTRRFRDALPEQPSVISPRSPVQTWTGNSLSRQAGLPPMHPRVMPPIFSNLT